MDGYKKTLDVMQLQLDKKVEHGATEVLKQARLSKACACLLEALTRMNEPSKLRTAVQAEMRELRQFMSKDEVAKSMHTILHVKVQAVLLGNA